MLDRVTAEYTPSVMRFDQLPSIKGLRHMKGDEKKTKNHHVNQIINRRRQEILNV